MLADSPALAFLPYCHLYFGMLIFTGFNPENNKEKEAVYEMPGEAAVYEMPVSSGTVSSLEQKLVHD